MSLQIILMSRFALPLILQIIDVGSFPFIFPLEIEVGLIFLILQSNELLTINQRSLVCLCFIIKMI